MGLAKIISLAVCVLLLTSQGVWAARQLTWLIADVPPLYIRYGSFLGQGYWEQSSEALKEQLSEYVMSEVGANLSRQYSLLKSDDKVCSMGFFKTAEREQFLIFSEALLYPESPVIVMTKERAEKFADGEVSLVGLLHENYLFGLSSGRSYGSVIDAIISENRSTDNVFEYEGENLSQGFLEMLSRGRIDALVLPPDDFYYNIKLLGLEDELVALRIAEVAAGGDDSYTTHIVCSKSAWGKRVMTKINSIIHRGDMRRRLGEAYGRWLPPELREHYRQRLRSYPWYRAEGAMVEE